MTTLTGETLVEISDAQFLQLRDYFYERTGISFAQNRRYFVDRRVAARIQACGYTSFRAWFTYMRCESSRKEFQELVNALTVNETYFYREEHQLEVLARDILPEIGRRRPGREVRMLSAPCSTGEEPYSIAMFLMENWPGLETTDVDLVACDINSEVLDACRRGVYGERAVSHLPREVLLRYFETRPRDEYQLDPDVMSCVNFTLANLTERLQMRGLGHYQVIFCRNVLIYFDEASRREVVTTFYDMLTPGGFLLLGHSESMARTSSLFQIRQFPRGLVYQRPWE